MAYKISDACVNCGAALGDANVSGVASIQSGGTVSRDSENPDETAVCPYCVRAKQLLQKRGVTQWREVRVDQNPAERTAMMERTGRRTVPQIYIGERHIGGCDELVALDQQGGLLPLLNAQEA